MLCSHTPSFESLGNLQVVCLSFTNVGIKTAFGGRVQKLLRTWLSYWGEVKTHIGRARVPEGGQPHRSEELSSVVIEQLTLLVTWLIISSPPSFPLTVEDRVHLWGLAQVDLRQVLLLTEPSHWPWSITGFFRECMCSF